MRKRTISHLADTIFWYLLYFLPVLVLLILCIHNPASSFADIFNTLGINIASDSLIFDTLSKLLGTGGILPLFNNSDVLIFFTYFINVYLIHLLVDFLLFIPRLAHKWLNKFTREDCE